MTPLVLALAAFALPLAVALWQLGRIREQAAFLDYKRGKYREAAEAAAKQAHEIQGALTARIASLEASTHERLTVLDTRVSHVEQGRVPQKRAA